MEFLKEDRILIDRSACFNFVLNNSFCACHYIFLIYKVILVLKMDASPSAKGLKSKLLWELEPKESHVQGQLDNLVKPKPKMLLKKLRKAGLEKVE